ncbi:MAG: DUF1328 domain-containing protein [Shimia sp.]
MTLWAVIFIIAAMISAAFGFGGLAVTASGVAQLLFVIFASLAVGAIVLRALRQD